MWNAIINRIEDKGSQEENERRRRARVKRFTTHLSTGRRGKIARGGA